MNLRFQDNHEAHYTIEGTTARIVICLLFSGFIAGTSPQKSIGARREQVPFSMAIENVEVVHECFPKHLGMGTARLN